MTPYLLSLIFLLLASVVSEATVAGNDSLHVISYNIRYDARGDKGERDWQQRKNKVTGYLAKNKASIIGLQEVLHRQLLAVDKALPKHLYVGVGRDDGLTKGEYSPIFYDQTVWKLDPQQTGTFWLSATPKVVNSRTWGNGISRICTWARLIGKNNQAIYIYNTHWDHRSQPSRVKAGELILKTIKSRLHQDDPYILLGDFNATTENPAVKQLLESGLFTDHGKKQMRTSNGWSADLLPGLRIDHILTSASLKMGKVSVHSNGNPAASDHHPVLLTLTR